MSALYEIVKSELRRVDPENPKLAFVEECESDEMVAKFDALIAPPWSRFLRLLGAPHA